MNSGSLKNQTAKSFFWVAMDVLGQRVLQFVIGIILARILLPSEYGLIGIISIFIAFSMIFIESGFSFALIRKPQIEDIEYTTVFWFNFVASTIFYVLLFISSPHIAGFYQQDILTGIIKLVGLNLIINAIGSIQNVRLRKQLRFKELTIISFVAIVISGGVALVMAYSGYGVWSLVAKQLVYNMVKVSLMIVFSWFLPKMQFSVYHFKSLFSFSYKLLLGGISYAISNNLYPVVIGKVFSIGEVGFFNRAKGLRDLPVLMFTKIIQQVTLPTFSNIQEETDRFINAYKISIRTSLFLILLPLLMLVLTAEPLIQLLLTEKWLPAAPILKILAIGSIFYPVSALNINIIGIQGRSDYVMILQLIKDGFVYIGVCIGLLFGIRGLLWSIAITGNLAFLINIYYTSKVVNYSMQEQLRDLLPVLLLALVSGALTYGISFFLSGSNLLIIIVLIFFLSLFYIGFARLFKMSEFTNTLDIFKKMFCR